MAWSLLFDSIVLRDATSASAESIRQVPSLNCRLNVAVSLVARRTTHSSHASLRFVRP
jgi:hypothetical protein